MKKIKAFKLHSDAKLPTRNLKTDAGLDIYSLYDVFIRVGVTECIPTGIALEILPGYVGKIEGRSSMNSKGLITAGGVIDAGYSGEIGITINNFSAHSQYSNSFYEGYMIKAGDKVAQLLVYKVSLPRVVEVKKIWKSKRNNKGFGSSGR